jgi:hypothetical protein
MNNSSSNMAQQIAQAASGFERERTGHAPKSVTVVLSEERWSSPCTGLYRRPRGCWLKVLPVLLRSKSSIGSCS